MIFLYQIRKSRFLKSNGIRLDPSTLETKYVYESHYTYMPQFKVSGAWKDLAEKPFFKISEAEKVIDIHYFECTNYNEEITYTPKDLWQDPNNILKT